MESMSQSPALSLLGPAPLSCSGKCCLLQRRVPWNCWDLAVLSQELVCDRDITREAACSQGARATDACGGQPEGHVQGLGLSGTASPAPITCDRECFFRHVN